MSKKLGRAVLGALSLSLVALALLVPSSFAQESGSSSAAVPASGGCTHSGQHDCYGLACSNGGTYLIYYKEFPNNPASATYEGKCGPV